MDARHSLTRTLTSGRSEAGISLVEGLFAIALLAVVGVGVVTVLTAGIASQRLSRERTIAEQAVSDQIEVIRRLPYSTVGTVSGNPPGTVPATRAISVRGLTATLRTQIAFVNDPVPTSYATAANYKRVKVAVVRDSNLTQLAQGVTYVAPPGRAPYGGINSAIVNAEIVDYALDEPVTGVTVNLATGPSAPRSDTTTQGTGIVTFSALTPNRRAAPRPTTT